MTFGKEKEFRVVGVVSCAVIYFFKMSSALVPYSWWDSRWHYRDRKCMSRIENKYLLFSNSFSIRSSNRHQVPHKNMLCTNNNYAHRNFQHSIQTTFYASINSSSEICQQKVKVMQIMYPILHCKIPIAKRHKTNHFETESVWVIPTHSSNVFFRRNRTNF